MRIRSSSFLFACLLIVAAACSSGAETAESPRPSPTARSASTAPDLVGSSTEVSGGTADEAQLPIVFVHGFAGSAQQYESQAMLFAANGYPQDRILAYEHDGAGFDIAGYSAGLGDFIDSALDAFAAEQVLLVAHSRGTMVSSTYLADAENAAKVARYVALDGAPCPEAVPCLALDQSRFPGQAHVEVATSPESFAAQYEYLIGEPPRTTGIEAQQEPVVLRGRAVNFPSNTGREGSTLVVWEVDPATGQRVDGEPLATFEIGPDGGFGPLRLEAGARYEYVLSSPDTPIQHHIYPQPYLRSSDLFRLLSSPPDGPIRSNTNLGDGHSALIVLRMREWYANDDSDRDGDERDVLRIGTDASSGSHDAGNVLAAFAGNGAIGLHLHDDAASPGQTTLAALPYLSQQPFQSGIDVFMPADPQASGTITVTNLPRGDATVPQVMAVPNWPSSGHVVTVVFGDHPMRP